MTAIADALVKERFAEWLRGHASDVVVGRAKEPCRCPVARYLRATGVAKPEVEKQVIVYQEPDSHYIAYYDQPPWVEWFVSGIDAYRRKGAPITAAEALACLVELEEQ